MRKQLRITGDTVYFFLGIVRKEDAIKGDFFPYYILRKTKKESSLRSGYIVSKPGQRDDNPKVLVTSLSGNEKFINILRYYRTRVHEQEARRYRMQYRKKYFPEGYLCYFECDIYGIQTGTAIIIMRVPAHEKGFQVDQAMQRNIIEEMRPKLLTETIVKEPLCIEIPTRKPILWQDVRKDYSRYDDVRKRQESEGYTSNKKELPEKKAYKREKIRRKENAEQQE